MTDSSGQDTKHPSRLSDEQRAQIEEKVRLAKQKHEQMAHEPPAQSAHATHIDQKAVIEDHSKSRKTEKDDTAHKHFEVIDKQQRDTLRHLVEDRIKSKQHLNELRKRLLSLAGKDVAIDEACHYNDLLMERGQTWNSLEVNLISGPEMNAERSVARLWKQSPTFYSIAAGYALDAADVWRQHVWLLAQHKVQEVKIKYAVYYGVLLSTKECEAFVIEALNR